MEKGLREGVLAVLGARGLEPDAEQRRRIEGESDAGRLRAWISSAAVAASAAVVLES